MLVGAVASVGSCVALTVAVGPIGAAVATLLGYLVTWGARTRVMRLRVARIRVSWGTELLTLGVLVVQAVMAMQEGLQLLQVPVVALVVFLRRRQLGSIWGFVRRRLGQR